jgi:hypothetical protein
MENSYSTEVVIFKTITPPLPGKETPEKGKFVPAHDTSSTGNWFSS